MELFIKQLFKFMFIGIGLITILLIPYIYYDPFQVVHKYNSYYVSGEPQYVTLNNDYVAVETFLKNYPDYKYDSFILGNSRSRFYEIDLWKKYIHSDKCFHFDASAETLYGIARKIQFLHQKQVNIKNVLIILDNQTLNGINNSSGHLFIKHPLLSGQNRMIFQFEFFKAFTSVKFLYALLDFKITGKIKEYMRSSALLNDMPVDYNLKYNELKFTLYEDMIRANPSGFYNEKRMKLFYSRDTTQQFHPQAIKSEQITLLNSIKRILNTNTVNYLIIISPLYDQIKINSKDLNYLKDLFGANHVFDFSGINSFTNDYHNYYELSHYRPPLCDSLLNIVYSGKGQW